MGIVDLKVAFCYQLILEIDIITQSLYQLLNMLKQSNEQIKGEHISLMGHYWRHAYNPHYISFMKTWPRLEIGICRVNFLFL